MSVNHKSSGAKRMGVAYHECWKFLGESFKAAVKKVFGVTLRKTCMRTRDYGVLFLEARRTRVVA